MTPNILHDFLNTHVHQGRRFNDFLEMTTVPSKLYLLWTRAGVSYRATLKTCHDYDSDWTILTIYHSALMSESMIIADAASYFAGIQLQIVRNDSFLVIVVSDLLLKLRFKAAYPYEE